MTETRKGPPSAAGEIAIRMANLAAENERLKQEVHRRKHSEIKLMNRNHALRQRLERMEK